MWSIASSTISISAPPAASSSRRRGQSRLFVSNSFITDNGNGILIRPTGSGIVNAVVKQVHLETNGVGLGVDGTAGTGKVTLSLVDSVAAGNGGGNLGVAVVTNGAKAIANVMINRASLSGSLVGLRATGPKAHRPDRQFRHLRQCDRRRRASVAGSCSPTATIS